MLRMTRNPGWTNASETVYFGDQTIRKANELPASIPQRPPTHADARTAKQLLKFFPWFGQLWTSAVRESGGGSIGRYKVLGILNGKGPIRAGELASLCASSPSAITEVIEGLAAEGLVRRVDDPTDRRAVVVALTDAGHVEVERVGDLMTAALVRVFDGLTADQRSRLRSAVAELNDILIDPPAKKETRIVR